VKKTREPVTLKKVRETHQLRSGDIRRRLTEFEGVWKERDDARLWEEMVFCFLTGGCSAKMGLRGIEALRPVLLNGTYEETWQALSGVHRYPFARSRYIIASRDFLKTDCGLKLGNRLDAFGDDLSRRDWLVKEKGIKGLGYKEASHYLRNIGFKGYAILDKHVLQSMVELGVIEDAKPPSTRTRYLETELKLKKFARKIKIDFDELDLVLWSIKTGEILK
jgi:N-glycosylase/DNA lyase